MAIVWVILVEVTVLEMEVTILFSFVDPVLDCFVFYVLDHFVCCVLVFLVHQFDSHFVTALEQVEVPFSEFDLTLVQCFVVAELGMMVPLPCCNLVYLLGFLG